VIRCSAGCSVTPGVRLWNAAWRRFGGRLRNRRSEVRILSGALVGRAQSRSLSGFRADVVHSASSRLVPPGPALRGCRCSAYAAQGVLCHPAGRGDRPADPPRVPGRARPPRPAPRRRPAACLVTRCGPTGRSDGRASRGGDRRVSLPRLVAPLGSGRPGRARHAVALGSGGLGGSVRAARPPLAPGEGGENSRLVDSTSCPPALELPGRATKRALAPGPWPGRDRRRARDKRALRAPRLGRGPVRRAA
jgi:hypothetical protein